MKFNKVYVLVYDGAYNAIKGATTSLEVAERFGNEKIYHDYEEIIIGELDKEYCIPEKTDKTGGHKWLNNN